MADGAGNEAGRGSAVRVGAAPDWLVAHRMAMPEPPGDYMRRDRLMQQCMPTSRRLTLLVAPAGFGKTTLLAACCRQAVADGVPVAWLAADGEDDASELDRCLALAFDRAGIAPEDVAGAGVPEGPAHYSRAMTLLHTAASLGRACVLALDEVELLTDGGALALLNFLVMNAPPQLHIAIACRELPVALDVAVPVLSGQAEVLTTEDLRFSESETAEFLGGSPSPEELREVAETLAGWPLALWIRRAGAWPGEGVSDAMRDVVSSYVESRLWRTLTEGDRGLLLDVGLLDWFDEELLDEVLDEAGVLRRLETMPGVAGLMQPVRAGPEGARRLHGLIREHCARRQRVEAPHRHLDVHRRVARALARRGHAVDAMRHARRANDADLAAAILVGAGGVMLLAVEGNDRLAAADRQLPRSLSGMPPRVALVRCAALAVAGQHAKARRAFAALAELATDDAGADVQVRAERSLVYGLVATLGCESAPTPEGEALLADAAALTRARELDPLTRGLLEMAVCLSLHVHGRLAEASLRAGNAGRALGHVPFMEMAVAYQRGQIAMAEGRADDAAALYRSGQALARHHPVTGLDLVGAGDVFLRELDLERNRGAGQGTLTRLAPVRMNAELAVRFAACDLLVATALAGGIDRALVAVDEMWDEARRGDLPALRRHLAAWRVSLLATEGRIEEAERTWQAAGLPDSDAGCASLDLQSWREAESVGCARVRVLLARGDHEGARRLCRTLLEMAAGAGLRRVEMRVLGLGVRIEFEAGDRACARARLDRFLGLHAVTGYGLALSRQGVAAESLLAEYVDGADDDGACDRARALLEAVRKEAVAAGPRLSERELEVLGRLERLRDRDIAEELGLTHHGVRYHVGNIFEKLGTHKRGDAVGRARVLGLLPGQ